MTRKPRPNNPEIRRLRFRLFLVAGGLLFGFLLLIARSLQVQFFQWEGWASVANKQVRRDFRFEPRRGDIFDCNGQELAASIEVESLAANPRLIEDPAATAQQLASVIQIPAASLEEKMVRHRSFVWLKHYLSPKQAGAVRVLKTRGIHFVKEHRRYYPNLELAGHVLGFVGRDHIGLEGLEVAQDLVLRGHSGTHPGAKDARGQIIYTHGLPAESGPYGYSLRLTLDKRIQYIAERELQETVGKYEAKGGTTVVIDPRSGEILAMAVSPTFNPNNFVSYTPSAWRNRAVTDAFEPGSTFKIFLAAAALEEGLVHPDDLFYCEQGEYEVLNHTVHDLKKFGWLSLAQILRFSSNIGAAKVAEKLGMELIDTNQLFGAQIVVTVDALVTAHHRVRFGHGLNRDGGELAQGAIDGRLLRRVVLPWNGFLRRFAGTRSLFGQSKQLRRLHFLQGLQAGLDAMLAAGRDPVQMFAQRMTQFPKTEVTTVLDRLLYLDQLSPGELFPGKGGRCQRIDRCVHSRSHTWNMATLLCKNGG